MAMQSSKDLIVNCLPQNMLEPDLYKLFASIGLVTHCKVVKDIKTGYSYCYGFVSFLRSEDAEKAIRMLNGSPISNKCIKVSYSRPSFPDELRYTNLYIANLPKHYREHDLEMMFYPFGEVIKKNLLVDKLTGMPTGVAFVKFHRKQDSQNAIRVLNGVLLQGSNKPLVVRVAQDHFKTRCAYYAGLKTGLEIGLLGQNPKSGYLQGGNANMDAGLRAIWNNDFVNPFNI